MAKMDAKTVVTSPRVATILSKIDKQNGNSPHRTRLPASSLVLLATNAYWVHEILNLDETDQHALVAALADKSKHEIRDLRRVPLPGLKTTDGAPQYLSWRGGVWFASRLRSDLRQQFTDGDLDSAPEWVQDLPREEVGE